MTLLEIYDRYLNGMAAAFYNEVIEYGESDFLIDIIEEYGAGVLNMDELRGMSKTIKVYRELKGG